MVSYLWAWQGPPSEGSKGKETYFQETEGFESGKEPPQVKHETKSGKRASDNSGGTEKERHKDTHLLGCNDTDAGDPQQTVAPKGPPNLKTAEPKGAMGSPRGTATQTRVTLERPRGP